MSLYDETVELVNDFKAEVTNFMGVCRQYQLFHKDFYLYKKRDIGLLKEKIKEVINEAVNNEL